VSSIRAVVICFNRLFERAKRSMDVDGDVDGTLAQAFGCMGTNDREVLVRQFQQLLGENHQVSADSCAFFLDMNNWYVVLSD
jgi:hypothetical protein